MSGFVGGDKHLVFSTYLLYPLVYRLILNQCETLEMQNIGWMGVPIEFSYMVVGFFFFVLLVIAAVVKMCNRGVLY